MWVSVMCMVVPLAATLAHAYIAPPLPNSVAETPLHTPALRERTLALSVAAWREVRRLRAPFWIVAFTFMTVASTTFTFVHFAPDVFDGRVSGIDASRASLLSGLLSLRRVLQAPLWGSPRILWVTGLRCSSVPAHAPRLCVAPVTLLSCIAVAVPPSALPLALGLYKSLENAGLAVVHVIVGRLRDLQKSYTWPLIFLSALAASAIPGLLVLGATSTMDDDAFSFGEMFSNLDADENSKPKDKVGSSKSRKRNSKKGGGSASSSGGGYSRPPPLKRGGGGPKLMLPKPSGDRGGKHDRGRGGRAEDDELSSLRKLSIDLDAALSNAGTSNAQENGG
eukprot:IDg12606t1